MALDEGAHQLNDAVEIKQEPDIKEEPEPVGNLVEDAAEAHPLADYSQFKIEGDSTDQTMNEIEIEVKEEVLQSNRSGETGTGVRGNEQKQHNCECTTKRKHDWNRYSRKHTGEKQFPCDHCAKSFASNGGLQSHMKIHVNEFLFHCSICLKGFDRKNEKVKHESNCKKIRYECHLCEKSFGPYKLNLTMHMCVHGGEKLFGCTECSKRFTTKGNLKMHMRLHAGARIFHCTKCRQEFSREDQMIEHEQNCSRRVYECHICGKFIGLLKGNLEKHMPIHTGDKPFECIQCSRKFTQKSYLHVHLNIHYRSLPWKCAICRQGFAEQFQWKAHQRNCTRRRYECHLCKQFFGSFRSNLKRHTTKHSGEKPFECGICRNRFTEKGNLTQHMNRIHTASR